MPSTLTLTLTLAIDGRPAAFEAGETILQVARRQGIEIPTLCHLEACSPSTSCLVCLVKVCVNGTGKLVPSCATKAVEGMVVESETLEVREARRTALELLLSDHTGDCLSPCHRICPLQLNIPVMIRHIERQRLDQAVATVRDALPLPAVLGRLCHRPCENGCRRGNHDQPAAIRDLERYVADFDMARENRYLPSKRPATRKAVVIVGSGPVGLAAADTLVRLGHACTVIDRQPAPGGSLRESVKAGQLPQNVLDAEIRQLERLGVKFKLGVELGRVVTIEGLLRGFQAVLLATGETPKPELAGIGLAAPTGTPFADARTGLTNVPNVFAAGSVVKPVRQLVKAMSEGVAVARCLHQFLAGTNPARSEKTFSSIMGRLDRSEVDLFLHGISAAPRIEPSTGPTGPLTPTEAPAEAARCLHCDCRAAGNCALQRYAQDYGADASRFREQRRPFEQSLQHGSIVFERGKCILCGICVQLAEQAAEPLGLTFIGRGFDVRVAAPFDKAIDEGLQKVGELCVKYCPTGALAFKEHIADATGSYKGASTGCGNCAGTASPNVGGKPGIAAPAPTPLRRLPPLPKVPS